MQTSKLRIAFLVAGLALFSLSSFAQSKKKLRAEIKELKSANTQLRNENRKIKYEKQQLEEEKKQVVELTTFFENEVYRLRKDSAKYHEAFEKSQVESVARGNTGSSYGGGGNDAVDPNDSRPCARNQANLKPDSSYFRDSLSPLNAHGWGVQVYSFGNLCNAQEKAEQFASKYRMWKTYIKVTETDGVKRFSVVYGTLKDEQQARIYCDNFKKIAPSPMNQNAFLVQH